MYVGFKKKFLAYKLRPVLRLTQPIFSTYLESIGFLNKKKFTQFDLHVRDFYFNFGTENLLFLTGFNYWRLFDISYFVLV